MVALGFILEAQTIPVPLWAAARPALRAACVKMGRKFIGIEREPKHFDIACRRIE
jgi:hypothetical protein